MQIQNNQFVMLQNSSIIKSNDIQPIFVVVKEMRLFINSIDGEVFSFVVKNDDFIRDIKMKIYDKIGLIVDEQILCYQGEILKDMMTLNDYEIINNSMIDVVGRLRGGMQIFIKLMNGRRIEIEIENRDKIRNLKVKIQDKIGLPLNEQKLVYQGRILQNNKTIDEYQLYDKSEISVVAKLGNDEIKIFAKTSDGKTVEIDVEKSVKIIDLKCNIEEEIGLIADKHKLVYQGVVLDDDKSIDEYEICDQSVINIVVKILISVTTSGGKIVTIEIYETDKIKDLKHQVQEKLELNLDKQKLVFEEKILDDDDKTIYEYQICDRSMIHLSRNEIEISVKMPNDEIFIIKALKSDRIINLKKKIEGQSGLKPDEQNLIWINEILDDEKTIDKYQIFDKSVINLEAKLINIEIFVEIIDRERVTIEIKKSEKIIDLKRKIQEQTGLHPDEQILIYQGGILDDDKTIEEYQICEKSMIHLKYEMGLFVKTLDGKTVTFKIKKSEKIIDIKNKIHEKIGLHSYEQILVYQGGMLQNSERIDQYEIFDKSVITIVARLRCDEVQISVKKDNGKIVLIEVKKSQKIIDLKEKIQQKTGLQRDKQILIYQDEILDDNDKIIDECQICEKSVINAFCKNE